MRVYSTSEFDISLPERLKDRTINVFLLSDDGPSEFNLVVSRDEMLENETIEAYLDRQLKTLSERVATIRIATRAQIDVDGEIGSLVDFCWSTPEGMMYQRQLAVVAPGLHPKHVVVFTGTTSEPLSWRWETTMNEILASVRFRR